MDFPIRNDDLNNEAEEAIKMVVDRDSGEGEDVNDNAGLNNCDSGEKEVLLHKEFPLVKPLMQSRDVRKKVLEKSGKAFLRSVSTSDGWMRTVFVLKERALDIIFWPWFLCTINATLWTILVMVKRDLIAHFETTSSLFDLVLRTVLAFLLVFRINRAAMRWWDTRTMWGLIASDARICTVCILEHVNHSPNNRDESISWLAAFVISTKQLLRDDKTFNREEIAGFSSLGERELTDIKQSKHACLYTLANIRHSLHSALKVSGETPAAVGFEYSSIMRMIEKHLDHLMTMVGGLERIKASPLPVVVVTHLRTFLLLYLLFMPLFHVRSLGWGTIPAVSLTAYILLEIDGAATELECPFQKRANHLAMEMYCLKTLNNIQDLYIENAQRRMNSRIHHNL